MLQVQAVNTHERTIQFAPQFSCVICSPWTERRRSETFSAGSALSRSCRSAVSGSAGFRLHYQGSRDTMVKEKPAESVRTFDENGFKRRAACLCFKDEREEEILLVTSHRYPERWVVPGGGIEPDEEPQNAAKREAMEEAGARGHIRRELGIFQNEERKNRTWVFNVHVEELLDDWVERINRKRQWFSVTDARAVLVLHKPAQAKYVDLFLEQRAKS